MTLERDIRERLEGKAPARGEAPKGKTAREIVEELTPKQRESLYDALVEHGGFWND